MACACFTQSISIQFINDFSLSFSLILIIHSQNFGNIDSFIFQFTIQWRKKNFFKKVTILFIFHCIYTKCPLDVAKRYHCSPQSVIRKRLRKKAPTNNEDRNLDSFGSSCWNVVYFMGVDCNFAEHSNGILLHFTIYSSWINIVSCDFDGRKCGAWLSTSIPVCWHFIAIEHV